jgi:hypothetical protein
MQKFGEQRRQNHMVGKSLAFSKPFYQQGYGVVGVEESFER